ncbi:MAG: phosphoribosylglycinamide formyltransferase [Chitinophagaceae bacterium]|nr:MAG: phosphoribosylglycinamide formyltransferase [Chitinophagaceae bacterium]
MGQFNFFKKYIAKIFSRFGGAKQKPDPITSIAIFASGTGSNAKKIIDYFSHHTSVKVGLLVSNKPEAPVLQIAEKAGIPTLVIDKSPFETSDIYIKELKNKGIDLIILAGFLWKVPSSFIQNWPGKIINIHPALLPNYGGKGMYGQRVHEAVIAAGDKESGISIHLVDEIYDHGKVIFQATCGVETNDNAETLAQKIHLLEHQHFAPVIEKEIEKQKGS